MSDCKRADLTTGRDPAACRHRLPQRMLRLAALVLALIAAAAPAQARDRHGRPKGPAGTPEAVAASLRDRALRGEHVGFAWASELTTRFGPRPAGSPRERAAAQWAAARLTALGFENVHIEDFPITAWERGTEHAELEGALPQSLAIAALGGSPPTPDAGLSAEVAPFESLEALRAVPPGALAGRIALITAHMVRTQDGSGYDTAVAARIEGPGEAAARGAIAFLMRSAGTDTHRLPHTGTTRYTDGRVAIPSFALSAPDAEQIERLAALGQSVRVHLYSSARSVPQAHSQNVVAEWRGRTHPQEIILLGAHLDSWDLGTGAIDDAAGTAIVTAAAKLVRDQAQRPARTLRVVLFGCEELAQPNGAQRGGGSAGGRAYAERHVGELANHVLAGESDLGTDRIYQLAAGGEGDFESRVQRLIGPLGIIPAARPAEDAGADIAAAQHAGVPVFALAQDATRYFDVHHTADDTLDKVDRAALDQNVAAWAALVWLAADGNVDFRKPAAPAHGAN